MVGKINFNLHHRSPEAQGAQESDDSQVSEWDLLANEEFQQNEEASDKKTLEQIAKSKEGLKNFERFGQEQVLEFMKENMCINEKLANNPSFDNMMDQALTYVNTRNGERIVEFKDIVMSDDEKIKNVTINYNDIDNTGETFLNKKGLGKGIIKISSLDDKILFKYGTREESDFPNPITKKGHQMESSIELIEGGGAIVKEEGFYEQDYNTKGYGAELSSFVSFEETERRYDENGYMNDMSVAEYDDVFEDGYHLAREKELAEGKYGTTIDAKKRPDRNELRLNREQDNNETMKVFYKTPEDKTGKVYRNVPINSEYNRDCRILKLNGMSLNSPLMEEYLEK